MQLETVPLTIFQDPQPKLIHDNHDWVSLQRPITLLEQSTDQLIIISPFSVRKCMIMVLIKTPADVQLMDETMCPLMLVQTTVAIRDLCRHVPLHEPLLWVVVFLA